MQIKATLYDWLQFIGVFAGALGGGFLFVYVLMLLGRLLIGYPVFGL